MWTGLLAVVLLGALTPAALAQNPGSGGPTPGDTTPAAVPLDGGATLLLASGLAYGLRHLRQRRAAR